MQQSTRFHQRLVDRSPVFYGWVVWAVATVGWVATSPGQSFSVSLFIDSFIADFGLDRTTVSSLYSLGTFVGSLSLTYIGRQIDLHGNRRMSMLITLLFALTLVAFSWVTGPIALLIGFIGIRGLGQGSLSLVSTTVIAQWFWRRRGMVMAFSTIIFSLFQAVYVPGVQRLLETYAWQQVWVMLGVGVVITVLPLTWLLMQNRPEDYGLTPDGNRDALASPVLQAAAAPPTPPVGAAPPVATPTGATAETSWTLREAMRTPIFWVFVLARLIPPSWATGLVLHQISIFDAVGHSARTAAETYALSSTLVAVFAIATGLLVDRLKPGILISIQLSAMITALLLATNMTTNGLLVLYALAMGLIMGSGGVFDNVVWVNLFGRQHQGTIRGFVITTAVVASAVGPVIFGFSFDYLGGYAPVLWLGALLCIPPIIAGFFVDKPVRRI